jgi:hypothetical protein
MKLWKSAACAVEKLWVESESFRESNMLQIDSNFILTIGECCAAPNDRDSAAKDRTAHSPHRRRRIPSARARQHRPGKSRARRGRVGIASACADQRRRRLNRQKKF